MDFPAVKGEEEEEKLENVACFLGSVLGYSSAWQVVRLTSSLALLDAPAAKGEDDEAKLENVACFFGASLG